MYFSSIDIGITIVYFAFVLWIDYASMHKVKSFSDYVVGSGNIPMLLVFATLVATIAGGGATIGRVAYIRTTGAVIILGLFGIVLVQLIAAWYVAPRIRK